MLRFGNPRRTKERRNPRFRLVVPARRRDSFRFPPHFLFLRSRIAAKFSFMRLLNLPPFPPSDFHCFSLQKSRKTSF